MSEQPHQWDFECARRQTTLPAQPHWYIVRNRTCPEALNVALFDAIRQHGYRATYLGGGGLVAQSLATAFRCR